MQPRSSRALLIAIAAIGITSSAAVHAQRVVEGLPAGLRDLATAQTVEVKDSTDAVVLKGTFVTSTETAKEVERTAILGGASVRNAANGKAEIELERSGTTVTNQEVEVTLKRLPPRATLKLFIDGEQVKSFVTNRNGDADLKFTRKVSPAS